MNKRGKVIVIIVSLIVLIGVLGFLLYNTDSNNTNNSSLNNTNSQGWETFNAKSLGITIIYPDSWTPQYLENPLPSTLDFSSSDKTNYIDPISGQTINEPIIKASVIRRDNVDKQTLSEWIKANTVDEVVRSQSHIRGIGWVGQRVMIYYERNAYKASSLTYYIPQNDSTMWELTAFISNDRPESSDFSYVVEEIDKSFQSVKFSN